MVDSGIKGLWRLTVRAEFSAAHALRHYQGKCERLHGHNFAVELIVEGDELEPETGMLVDFSILKKILAQVLEPLDHSILNDVPPFDEKGEINPSSELLARHIGQNVAAKLVVIAPRARVYGVSVSEKGAQSALWLARGEMPHFDS